MSSTIKYALVTHVIDPHNFHAQIGDDDYFLGLSKYENWLNNFGKELYKSKPNLIGVCEDTNRGDYVLAYSLAWGKWVRAVIIDTENSEVDVYRIDYGTSEMVKADCILRDATTGSVPAQAYQCSLAGVKPIATEWISRAVSFFSDLVLNEKLACEVVNFDPLTSLLVVDLIIPYPSKDSFQSASKILCNEEFAMIEQLQSKKGKVPAFDKSRLQWKQILRSPSPEVEADNDEIETELFRKAVGASDDRQEYVRSDITIGDGYQPNIDTASIQNLQDEIRAMTTDTNQPVRDTGERVREQSSRAKPRGRGRGIRKRIEESEEQNRLDGGSPRSTKLGGDRGKPYLPPSPNAYEDFSEASSNRSDNSSPRSVGNPKPQQNGSQGEWKEGLNSDNSGSANQKAKVKGRVINNDGKEKRSSKARSIKVRSIENEAMSNDYHWYKGRVEQACRKILRKIDTNVAEDIMTEIDQLVFPSKSKLKRFRGHKELHICLECLTSNVVNRHTTVTTATTIFDRYNGHETFPRAISEILKEFDNEIIKITTNVEIQKQREPFCQLLGQLFRIAQKWDTPSRMGEFIGDKGAISSIILTNTVIPVVTFVSNAFHSWCTFKQKKEKLTLDERVALYGPCLQSFVPIAGKVMEESLPDLFQDGFKELKDKIIDPTLNRENRLLLMDLVIQHMAEAKAHNAVPLTPVQKERWCQVGPGDLSWSMDRETETLPNPTPSRHSVETQTDRAGKSTDTYSKVTEMLVDIELKELIPVFQENAIRDSLLDMPFSDLKELLTEVGLKPGHIWAIKKYQESSKCSLTSTTYPWPPRADVLEERRNGAHIKNYPQSCPCSMTRSQPTSPSSPTLQLVPAMLTQPKYPNLLTPSSFSVPYLIESSSTVSHLPAIAQSRDPTEGAVRCEGTNTNAVSRGDLDTNWRTNHRETDMDLQ